MSDLRKFFAKEMDEEIQKVRDEYEKQILELNNEINRLKNYTHSISVVGSGAVGSGAVRPVAIGNGLHPVHDSKYQGSWKYIDEAAKLNDEAFQRAYNATFNKKKEKENEHP